MINSKLIRVALVAVLAAALAAPTGFASALVTQVSLRQEQEQIADAKIHTALKTALEDEEFVHILIKLREQVDAFSVAQGAMETLPERATPYNRKMAARYAVVAALRETAASTQGPTLKYLEAEMAQGQVKEINPYFIVNMIHAHANAGVIRELSLRPEVETILPSNWIELEQPLFLDSADGPGRQWNLEQIEAYAVWDAYGLDGTGVVVGIIDTGTHFEHEALKEKWRGYDPEGNHNPVFNWFDAVNGRAMPYDIDDVNYCHGTHVMGTILGSHPESNNLIGVAPGARWITAKAFIEEGGYDHWLLAAGEYMLAPTDEEGNPNPAMAPDVINNSWGGGSGLDEWYRPMVQAWRAAGIVPVFSAGNTSGGSSPGSVSAPANYPECIAVAATDSEKLRANFSNQGPGPYPDLKPDLSAPGVAIRSSVIGGYSAAWSGTSMASPHVTGTVALLLQANAGLSVAEIEEILMETAVPLTDAQYPESPNYGYGVGLVNAFEAVTLVVSGSGTVSGQVLAGGEDTEPPVIDHSPVEFAFAESDVTVSALIADEVAVVSADLYVKFEGQDYWIVVPMSRVAGNHLRGEYTGTIPWIFIQEPGFTYKIVARDWGKHTTESPEYYVEVLFGIEPGTAWDFEEYPFGWYWDGDWQWGEPTVGPEPLTGTRLFATNLNGNYSNYSDSWLLSPPLDLREASEASFRLQHWYDIEKNYDVGLIAITADYGETWDFVEEFSQRSQQWHDLLLDLNSYAGSANQVYVLFAFMSDISVNYPGWYLDNIDFVGLDTEAPAVPGNLQAAAGTTGINLTWNAVSDIDAAGYSVYRSETSGLGYEKIAVVTSTAYNDTVFEAGTEYFYVVTAFDYSGNESAYSNEVSALAPNVAIYMFADFEEDNGGFTSGGTNNSWEWGTPSSGPMNAYSGSKVWATNLAGNYLNSANCWLQTPEIDLAGCTDAALEFAHWYNIETNYDRCYIHVSSNGGLTWIEVASYTGTKASWDLETIPLDYAGETIKIRFIQTSDYSVNRPGWYIDDVKIVGTLAEPAAAVEASIQELKESKPVRRVILRPLRQDPSAYTWYRSDQPRPEETDKGIPVDAVLTVVESGRSVRTDPATGLFRMVHPASPEGESWTLRVEAYGYHTQEIPFVLEVGEDLILNPLMEAVPRGRVEGTVVCSRTGEPISGADISLLEDPRVPWTASDEQGNFQFDNVLEGEYTLRVTAEGYHSAELAIPVVGGETSTIQVELKLFIGYDDEIAYDDGVAENARAYYDGNNGWGVRFTPDGPAQVIGASVYIWGNDWPSPGDNKLAVAVFDSLPNGEPGKMVIQPFVVQGVRGQWNFIDLSSYGFATDRDFYIVNVQVGNYPNCAGLGFDESSFSGRTYEWFGGEFAPVAPDYGNAMIRAKVQYSLAEPVLTAPADGTHTNAAQIPVAGLVSMDSLVSIFVNGEEAAQVQAADGQFETVIDLAEGENAITATAKIEAGETDPSLPVTVIKDTVAPELAIMSPADGYLTNKEVVAICGTASDQYLAGVTVNGDWVDLVDGAFNAKVIVAEGENVITVQAFDLAGNSAAETITVYVKTTIPQIFAIEPAAPLKVRAGDLVEVSFSSDAAGGSASFFVALPGVVPVAGSRVNMVEEEEGFYKGIWTVPAGSYFEQATVEIELVDAAGNRATATAPGTLSTGPAPVPAPPPAPVDPVITRISGPDRFATAVEVSKSGWEQAETVILARADDFADALAGVPLAYKLGAPILLSGPKALHSGIKGELVRLGAGKVLLLGGTGVISEAVAGELREMGLQVERISGRDRYATAAAIAARVAPNGADTVLAVSGLDFPDALAAASYAAISGRPILPVSNRIPAPIQESIESLGVRHTLVVGGPAAVSDDLLKALPGATRVSGADRYATAVALAEHFGLVSDEVFVAGGLSFADAITGAVLAARRGCGLLLVGNTVPPEVAAFLSESDIVRITVLGGPAAVDTDLVKLLATLLR